MSPTPSRARQRAFFALFRLTRRQSALGARALALGVALAWAFLPLAATPARAADLSAIPAPPPAIVQQAPSRAAQSRAPSATEAAQKEQSGGLDGFALSTLARQGAFANGRIVGRSNSQQEEARLRALGAPEQPKAERPEPSSEPLGRSPAERLSPEERAIMASMFAAPSASQGQAKKTAVGAPAASSATRSAPSRPAIANPAPTAAPANAAANADGAAAAQSLGPNGRQLLALLLEPMSPQDPLANNFPAAMLDSAPESRFADEDLKPMARAQRADRARARAAWAAQRGWLSEDSAGRLLPLAASARASARQIAQERVEAPAPAPQTLPDFSKLGPYGRQLFFELNAPVSPSNFLARGMPQGFVDPSPDSPAATLTPMQMAQRADRSRARLAWAQQRGYFGEQAAQGILGARQALVDLSRQTLSAAEAQAAKSASAPAAAAQAVAQTSAQTRAIKIPAEPSLGVARAALKTDQPAPGATTAAAAEPVSWMAQAAAVASSGSAKNAVAPPPLYWPGKTAAAFPRCLYDDEFSGDSESDLKARARHALARQTWMRGDAGGAIRIAAPSDPKTCNL